MKAVFVILPGQVFHQLKIRTKEERGSLSVNQKSVGKDYFLIIVGSTLMAFAIKNMYSSVNLVTGGVSGIAIIMQNLAKIPLWLTNTILNIPLFLFSLKIKGWTFLKRTFIATVTLSIMLYLLPEINILTSDIFLASLFGGILTGIGAGLVFQCHATTGGTDMLAALIQRKYKQYSIAQIMQVLDAIIVLAGATIFGVEYALYALIAIFAVSKISDGMIEGLKFAKAAYIISDKNDLIATMIMKQLDRGVTALDAVGMYSGEERTMLFCVVSRKEIIQIKEIVAELDPKAFVIVSDVREVLGEGFIEF